MKNRAGRALAKAVLWMGLALVVVLAVPTVLLVGAITAVWSGADSLAGVFDKDPFRK